jgi:toxin ParE1/3/4
MTYRVERSERVWRDLEEIADFIANESLDAALRFYEAAEAAFEELAQMPEMGASRTFRNSRLGLVRMWPIPRFENWLIFYRPIDQGIEVLRVLHSARDINALFVREDPFNPLPEDET